MDIKEWAKKGKMVPVFNTRVFVIDEGNHENTLVMQHGYASSSIDYAKILPILTKHYRVILQDFVGFGFSDKPKNFYYDILQQAEVCIELWKILDVKNITLLTHNYGTKIALEILNKQKTNGNIDVKKLIILNSTISFDLSNLSKLNLHPLDQFSDKIILMLNSFPFFKMKIKDFFYDKNCLTDEEILDRWNLLENKNGREIIGFLSSYITESKLLWNRWYRILHNNNIPTKIICGKDDTIFNENEAIRFSEEFKNSSLFFIENCGHYPMLEKPEELTNLITHN